MRKGFLPGARFVKAPGDGRSDVIKQKGTQMTTKTKANTTAKALQTGSADATLIDEFCGQQALQGHDVARTHSSEIDTRADKLPAIVEVFGSQDRKLRITKAERFASKLDKSAGPDGYGKELSPMPKVTGSSATFRLALDD